MECVTISDLVSAWVRGEFGEPVSPGWARTRRYYSVHMIRALGGLRPADLRQHDLWRAQDYGKSVGLAPATINRIFHDAFRAMLRDAERTDLIPRGVREQSFEGVKKLRENGEAWTSLTVEERDSVILAFADHWAYPLVAFLFFTGVRVGEAAGVRQRDIDWQRRTVRIARSRHKEELSPCKTKRSQRALALPHAALAAISGLRKDDAPESYLFRSSWGADFNQDAFRYRDWLPTLVKAGLPVIRIHDTRHTFATLALEAGIPIAKVAAYLGDRIQTVEARYAHVIAIDDWDRAVSAPPAVRVAK
jgi:integrase